MRRRLLLITLTLLISAGVTAGCGSSSTTSSGTAASSTSTAAGTSSASATSSAAGASPQIGFEGVPLQQGPELAPAGTTQTGTVDGIECGSKEQLAYHIHAHLAVFENGTQFALPAGVGIPGSTAPVTNEGPIASGGTCIYWLHTHTTDGVIHIESPTKRIYTLGNFFDVWHQPLGPDQVAKLHGTIRSFINGTPWTKNPRDIPLLPHSDIQLEIGQPAPPIVTIDWSKTQL